MTSYPGLPIGRLALDTRFAITDVDAEFQKLFGAGAELVGRQLDELVSDRDSRGAVALAGRLNSHRGELIDLALVLAIGGRDHFVRVRIVTLDSTFVVYVEPGDQEGSLTYELALARQRWQGVLQRSDEGIVLLDRGGAMVQYNARFHELMDFRTSRGVPLSEAALEGRPLAPILPAAFGALRNSLETTQEDISTQIEVGGAMLAVESRTLRLPLSGRVETLILVRDESEARLIAERDSAIQADLMQAAEFQRALLARPRSPRGLEVGIVYEPIHKVGGDVFDAVILADGTFRLFIADATGHGITAALSTMLIKSEYDTIKDDGNGPATTLATLNDRITRLYHRLSVVFTAMVVDIQTDRRSMRYACAAHPAPILHRANAHVALDEGGTFVGAAPGQDYPEWLVSLDGWTSLALITDGLVEAHDPAGDEFGDPRLIAAISAANTRGVAIDQHVLAELRAFLRSSVATDDLTLIAVRPTTREPS